MVARCLHRAKESKYLIALKLASAATSKHLLTWTMNWWRSWLIKTCKKAEFSSVTTAFGKKLFLEPVCPCLERPVSAWGKELWTWLDQGVRGPFWCLWPTCEATLNRLPEYLGKRDQKIFLKISSNYIQVTILCLHSKNVFEHRASSGKYESNPEDPVKMVFDSHHWRSLGSGEHGIWVGHVLCCHCWAGCSKLW